MTSKERLHKLVDELSEAEADETLRFAVARHEGRNVDEWGDLDAFGARSSSAALRRLDEQEASAGFSWEEHRPSRSAGRYGGTSPTTASRGRFWSLHVMR